ncbi:MAG: 4-hydroxy-tetrahydrodipicolinate synthase, partial [Betaproteobacteria bacterium]|nr:4-hydroxy-tetrahydrodipicolinate synthase [Betaproteobacteria bacterium]
ESGTSAIVAVGTTGESPTVDHEENCKLIEEAVHHAAGRIPVIAGTGSNSTREALELTRFASKVGAQASLQVVPYYNKPTQEGMYQHFRCIAESGGLPIIVYNVPGRTVADLSNDTVLRLAQLPAVIGVKDATGDIPRGSDLLARLPRHVAVYSGNDDSALALMAMGGHGVISVTANVAPKAMARLCQAAFSGRWDEALAINRQLLPLHFKLFVEANPIPAKWALHQMGRIKSGIRLPLIPLSEAHKASVHEALRESGVLS